MVWGPCSEGCQALPGVGQTRMDPVPSQPVLCLLPQKPSSGSLPLPPGHSRNWKRRSGVTGLSRWVPQSLSNPLGAEGVRVLRLNTSLPLYRLSCLP